jgi:protein O-mannosyl-transferase
MVLSGTDQEFIRKNFRKLSVRKIAKELGCSRAEVEDAVAGISAGGVGTKRFIPRIPIWGLGLVLVLLTFFTYSNSLRFDFVFDDLQLAKYEVFKKDFSESVVKIFTQPLGYSEYSGDEKSKKEASHYRPMHLLVDDLNVRLGGLTPFSFHLVNVLLQCVAALGVFGLLWRLLDQKEVAFWTAAFFAVHPVQIAAVTYVSGRAEVITMIFMLCSFYLFYKAQSFASLRRILALSLSSLAYLAAVFTKELALVLPLILLAYLVIFKPLKGFKIKFTDFLGFGAAAICYVIIRVAVLGEVGEGAKGALGLGDRLYVAVRALAFYLKTFIWPTELRLSHQFPRTNFGEGGFLVGLVILGVLVAMWMRSRQNKIIRLGWAWFWIFLLPVLNLFFLLHGPVAEHWLYNPSIGFFMVITAFLTLSPRPALLKRFAEPLLATMLLAFALTTFHANTFWKNEITLYENILKYTSHRSDIFHNLGVAYGREGMKDKAKAALDKAKEIDAYYASPKS